MESKKTLGMSRALAALREGLDYSDLPTQMVQMLLEVAAAGGDFTTRTGEASGYLPRCYLQVPIHSVRRLTVEAGTQGSHDVRGPGVPQAQDGEHNQEGSDHRAGCNRPPVIYL